MSVCVAIYLGVCSSVSLCRAGWHVCLWSDPPLLHCLLAGSSVRFCRFVFLCPRSMLFVCLLCVSRLAHLLIRLFDSLILSLLLSGVCVFVQQFVCFLLSPFVCLCDNSIFFLFLNSHASDLQISYVD